MKTMICIGDSLTEGADIPVGHTWPELVGNALQIRVINRGVGGDTTQGMLSRFAAEMVVEKPEFVFIMGGTNDLWWGLEVNAVLSNLFSLVFQARHHGITPIIGLPLPIHTDAARKSDFSPPWDGYDGLMEKMGELVETLTIHAQESEVARVDLHRPFFDDRKKIRGGLFLPDGLHPGRAGHLLIVKTIVSEVQEQFAFNPQYAAC